MFKFHPVSLFKLIRFDLTDFVMYTMASFLEIQVQFFNNNHKW